MKTNTWICPFCEDEEGMPKEFKTSEEYMKHHKELHPTGLPTKKEEVKKIVVTKPEVQDVVETVKQPSGSITLTYKYVGQCPVCGKETETIPLDIDGKVKEHFCIAWCSACKKSLMQRKVVKL